MSSKLVRPLLFVILTLRLTSVECVLPVKGIPSLGSYEKIHEHLAHCVVDSQIPQIVAKITKYNK